MDALTCGIFLAIFVLLSVFGSKMVEKWSVKKKKKNKWKNDYHHNEEYMRCLILEWIGFMLFISCGIVSFIYAVMLFALIGK